MKSKGKTLLKDVVITIISILLFIFHYSINQEKDNVLIIALPSIFLYMIFAWFVYHYDNENCKYFKGILVMFSMCIVGVFMLSLELRGTTYIEQLNNPIIYSIANKFPFLTYMANAFLPVIIVMKTLFKIANMTTKAKQSKSQ